MHTSTVRYSAAVRRVAEQTLRSHGGGDPADLVSLAVGEPYFDTPPQIRAAAVAALAAGATHYAPKEGLAELREELASCASAVAGRNVLMDEVLITHGATGGLTNAIVGLVNPGDRVVLPDPTYSLFADLIHLVGATCVRVASTPDFRWDVDQLAEALEGATMFVFCNPCNPTGIVHSRAELEFVAKLLDQTDTVVLADEAYSALTYDRDFCSTLSLPGLADRLVYCQTFSKAYAMTGWRIGYLVAQTELLKPAAYVQVTTAGAVNTAVQHAALTALRTGSEDVARMRQEYEQRRTIVLAELAQLRQIERVVEPGGAFYAFVRYRNASPAVEVVRSLRENGVAVRPGSEFGPAGEGHLRLSYAADVDAIRAGVRRIGRGLDALD